MTRERYQERFWMSVRRAKLPPASSCPRCLNRGHLTGAIGALLAFECACGRQWQTTAADAQRHAVFLQKLDKGWASEKREA